MRIRVGLVVAAFLVAMSAIGLRTHTPTVAIVEAQGKPGPARSVLLDTVTTGAGQFDASSYQALTFYLSSVGTTSGGVVSIEEADWNPSGGSPYTGTWSVITTVNASSFTGGVQLAYHVSSPTAFAFVRARVSSTITGGGTISVVLRAQ